MTATDIQEPANGRTYWYTVVAVTADNVESPYSNEVSATPRADIDNPPHLVQLHEDKALAMNAGQEFSSRPRCSAGPRR